MPYYKEHMRAAIRRMIDQVKENVYTRLCTLSAEAFVTAEPLPYEARMQGTHKTLQIGEKWGELGGNPRKRAGRGPCRADRRKRRGLRV